MFALINKTVRKNLITLLIYSAISVAFVWMFVALFPSFYKERESLQQAFESYPEGFLQALDVEVETFISSIEGFLAAEHFSILWPIILIILVVSYASSAIAGEIDKGTIELLLSQPISRLKIFFAKYFAGLALIVVFTLISNFSVIPFGLLHNVDFQFQNYWTISILGFLFAFAIFGICMMISSFSSTRGRPAAITGGVLIIMYGVNLFASFQEAIDFLKYTSFFHYYDFNSAIVLNQIDWVNASVFFVVGLITTIIGAAVFVKRDIATT